MQYKRTILDNGLRVITVPMPSLESATVLVMVGAGSRYETKQNNGISHFLEHMAFKGTEKRPTAHDISATIDAIGGEFNAFTSKEVTGFYVKSLADHADISLDVISDLLQNSKFAAEEIEKERGVIIQEINMYEDMPIRKIGDVYEDLVYGDTPLGWDIAGNKKNIREIQREVFINYMSRLYSPSNMTVVVAGGIENEKALEQVKKYFGKMSPFSTVECEPVVVSQEEPRFLLKPKKTEQAHMAIGVRTSPLCSADRYPLSVMGSVLGGGMSSRLFTEVREKRSLAYYVRCYSQHYTDHGNLTVYSGVNPDKAEEAEKVILEELVKIRDNADKISKKEFEKAKEYLKGHLVLELENSRDVAAFYGEQEILEEEIENPDKVLKRIDDVTVEDIKEVAKKYVKNEWLNMAMIGNFDNGQKFENLLKLD